MTITLSLNEIRNIVIGRYSLPDDTLVEVAGMVKIVSLEVEEFFAAMKPFCLENGTINPTYKIAAIKKLREFYPGGFSWGVSTLGLATAKYAIEDWANFSNKILINNRLPSCSPLVDNGNFVW